MEREPWMSDAGFASALKTRQPTANQQAGLSVRFVLHALACVVLGPAAVYVAHLSIERLDSRALHAAAWVLGALTACALVGLVREFASLQRR